MRREVAALTRVALAGAVLATGPGAGATPPPPATMDARGVDAWRQAYIQADGWTLMHADGAALSYARAGGPEGLKPDASGVMKIDVRREYYRPVRLGPQSSRSNYQAWLVDCEGRRLKVTGMTFYVQNNMKGGGFRKDGSDATWTGMPPEAQDSPLFDRICASQPPPPGL